MNNFQNKERYPNLSLFYKFQLEIFPRHEQFLKKRLDNLSKQDLLFIEKLAHDIRQIASNDLVTFCKSYHWFTREVTRESLYFNKHKKYRYEKFSDVESLVYSDEN